MMTIRLIEHPFGYQPVLLHRLPNKRTWTPLRVGDVWKSRYDASRAGSKMLGETPEPAPKVKPKTRTCVDCYEVWEGSSTRCPFCSGYLRKSRSRAPVSRALGGTHAL